MGISIHDISEGAVLRLERDIKAVIKICRYACVEVHFTDDDTLDLIATVYYEGNGLLHPKNESDITFSENSMFFENAHDMAVVFKFLALLEDSLV